MYFCVYFVKKSVKTLKSDAFQEWEIVVCHVWNSIYWWYLYR